MREGARIAEARNRAQVSQELIAQPGQQVRQPITETEVVSRSLARILGLQQLQIPHCSALLSAYSDTQLARLRANLPGGDSSYLICLQLSPFWPSYRTPACSPPEDTGSYAMRVSQ